MKYIWLFLTIILLLLALFMGIPKTEAWEAPPFTFDPRPLKVKFFFERYQCPVDNRIAQFIQAGDKYGLDYRILPVIYLVESSCGKHGLYNNYLGIGGSSHLRHYKTPKDGIDDAARIIASLKLKFGVSWLSHYSPTKSYPEKIQGLIKSFDK